METMRLDAGMSPADVKALTSNGNGFDNGNTMAYILLLLLFGRGGYGMSGTDGQQTVLRAIDGSDADIRQLGNLLNADVNQLESAICDIKTGMAAQTGAINTSAQSIINSIQNGTCTLQSALASCCCDINRNIDRTNLNLCNAKADLTSEIVNNRFANQMGFKDTQNEICNGFANVNFQNQANTAAITNTIKSEGADTRALIRDREFAQLEKENSQLRQNAQTEHLERLICCGCNSITPRPVPPKPGD